MEPSISFLDSKASGTRRNVSGIKCVDLVPFIIHAMLGQPDYHMMRLGHNLVQASLVSTQQLTRSECMLPRIGIG